jgi:hypothetical protein
VTEVGLKRGTQTVGEPGVGAAPITSTEARRSLSLRAREPLRTRRGGADTGAPTLRVRDDAALLPFLAGSRSARSAAPDDGLAGSLDASGGDGLARLWLVPVFVGDEYLSHPKRLAFRREIRAFLLHGLKPRHLARAEGEVPSRVAIRMEDHGAVGVGSAGAVERGEGIGGASASAHAGRTAVAVGDVALPLIAHPVRTPLGVCPSGESGHHWQTCGSGE